MQQSSNASPPEASLSSTTNSVTVLPVRSLWGCVFLVLLTVGSLGVAWLFPEKTMLHFLWVAQVLPVLYLLLVWWGTHTTPQPDDAQ